MKQIPEEWEAKEISELTQFDMELMRRELNKPETKSLVWLLSDGFVEVGEQFPRFAVKYADSGRLDKVFKEIQEGLYQRSTLEDYRNELYGE